MFIDEFGDSCSQSSNASVLNNVQQSQPFIITTGTIIKTESLPKLTKELMDAKRHFFPKLLNKAARKHPLNWLSIEIKGASFKKRLRDNEAKHIKHYKNFFKKIISLLKLHKSKIISRIYIKPHDKKISFENIYTSSIQKMAEEFNIFLEKNETRGMIILDSRDHHRDKQVCYSLVTKMYNRGKNCYPNIIEAPTFGQDNNHIGLQLSDWLTSGLISPIVGYTYLNNLRPNNIHCHKNYKFLKDTFKNDLKYLQFRYKRSDDSRFYGGIYVSNPLTRKGSYEIFR